MIFIWLLDVGDIDFVSVMFREYEELNEIIVEELEIPGSTG